MNENRQLVAFEEVQKQATCVSKSGLFGMKTPEQALTMMLVAQAEGRHPIEGPMRYHIIDGKPSKKSDAMLADFQLSGGKVEWLQYSDDCVEAVFSHPASPRPVTIKWDGESVKLAGLGNMHKKYPRAMKRARVISEGVRTCYPAATGLLYTPEEALDFEPVKCEVIQESAPKKKPAKEKETYETIPAPAQTVREPEPEPEIIEPEPLTQEPINEPINEPIKPTILADRKAIIAQHIKRIAMGNVEDDYINRRIDEIGEEAYVSAWEHFGEEFQNVELARAIGILKLTVDDIRRAKKEQGILAGELIPSEVMVDAVIDSLRKIRVELDEKPKTPAKTPAGIKVPNMGF